MNQADVKELERALRPFADLYKFYLESEMNDGTDAGLMAFMALAISAIPLVKMFKRAAEVLESS